LVFFIWLFFLRVKNKTGFRKVELGVFPQTRGLCRLIQGPKRRPVKGGEKMKKEKLEQLKKVFNTTAKKVFDKGYDNMIRLKDTDKYFDEIADQLAYEVKIRINNK